MAVVALVDASLFGIMLLQALRPAIETANVPMVASLVNFIFISLIMKGILLLSKQLNELISFSSEPLCIFEKLGFFNQVSLIRFFYKTIKKAAIKK